jgi:hypothetical protein
MEPPDGSHHARSGGRRASRPLTLHSLLVPRSWPLAWLVVALIADAALAPAARACEAPAPPQASALETAQAQARSAVVFSGPAFGSRYTVRVVMAAGDEPANEKIRTAIATQIALSNRLLSGWDPGLGDLAAERARLDRSPSRSRARPSRRSSSAGARASCRREPSMRRCSRSWRPWGFGPKGTPGTVPSDEQLAALRARVGYRQLVLDGARSTVAKARPDVACDVSAIGDGWSADRIARAIVALGHPDVLVDVGGEVAARGRRADGGRWRVAVEWPDGAREHTLVLELADAGGRHLGRLPQGLDRRSGAPPEPHHRPAHGAARDARPRIGDGRRRRRRRGPTRSRRR